MSTQSNLLDFGARRKVYTVADLTTSIKGRLEREFPDVRVAGEISNARQQRSGHWYFTLKDERAQLSCVCLRRSAYYLRTKPTNGLEVIAHGRLSVYEPQGKYQLYVDSIEPRGEGALQVRFERLKAKLQAEGLFDEERKRPLPPIPRRIGIVTSPTGAVIADMLRVMQRRFPGLHVRLFPVRVQGDRSAEEIARGVRHFSEGGWADIVIAGRGGGSLEDLWSFNDEGVARAIAACAVPVVSAVGHETDFTIADFVADRRAPTPSAAAEIAVPEAAAVGQRLREVEGRAGKALRLRFAELRNRVLRSGMERGARIVEQRLVDCGQALDGAEQRLYGTESRRVRDRKERLDRLDRRLAGMDLRVRLARQSQRLAHLAERLRPAASQAFEARSTRLAALDAGLGILRARLERKSSRLGAAAARLGALSPLAILERGYAIVQDRSGRAVRESRQVSVGEALSVRLHRGALGVRVESAGPEPENRSATDGETL